MTIEVTSSEDCKEKDKINSVTEGINTIFYISLEICNLNKPRKWIPQCIMGQVLPTNWGIMGSEFWSQMLQRIVIENMVK